MAEQVADDSLPLVTDKTNVQIFNVIFLQIKYLNTVIFLSTSIIYDKIIIDIFHIRCVISPQDFVSWADNISDTKIDM